MGRQFAGSQIQNHSSAPPRAYNEQGLTIGIEKVRERVSRPHRPRRGLVDISLPFLLRKGNRKKVHGSIYPRHVEFCDNVVPAVRMSGQPGSATKIPTGDPSF